MSKSYKPDISDLTGDPDLDAELAEEGGPATWRQSDLQSAETRLTQRIMQLDTQAAEAGIKNKPWWHDETADEYHDYAPGLPDEYKRQEWERGAKLIASMSRQDHDATKAAFAEADAFTEDLYNDYLDANGNDASPQEVAAAAQRVVERWRLEGSRDVSRRIKKDRQGFLDAVAVEVAVGDVSESRNDGGAHRTAGVFGGSSGGAARGPSRDSDDGKPLFAELHELQKREGYY